MGMTRAARLEDLLRHAFNPDLLEIRDESARHAGHAGSRPEGETHFHIRISSQAFVGKSRVEQHRLVNQVLANEFARGLHALSLSTCTLNSENRKTT